MLTQYCLQTFIGQQIANFMWVIEPRIMEQQYIIFDVKKDTILYVLGPEYKLANTRRLFRLYSVRTQEAKRSRIINNGIMQ